MPPRVPHTEYPLEMHFGAIRHFTGIEVSPRDDAETRRRAGVELTRALNYDLIWSTLTGGEVFGGHRTDMGHAVYQEGGVDYRALGKPLFAEPEEVFAFDPWEALGARDTAALAREYSLHYARQAETYPDAVNMTGVYVTMMSGLIDILGWDALLTAAGHDPAAFGAAADRYAAWIGQYFDALALSDAPVVMIHDDIVWTSGPFIHPDWYRRYIFPNYKRLFAPLREAGKIILFTSDGDYTMFVDDIAECGVHGFVMEPMTDMAYIAERYGRTHAFVGNADTRILLRGRREEIQAEVARCMAIGKSCPGFFMAVGNHIPPNTPLDSILWYLDAYERMSRR